MWKSLVRIKGVRSLPDTCTRLGKKYHEFVYMSSPERPGTTIIQYWHTTMAVSTVYELPANLGRDIELFVFICSGHE